MMYYMYYTSCVHAWLSLPVWTLHPAVNSAQCNTKRVKQMRSFMCNAGDGYPVVRYHSLVVDEATLPEALQAIAWTSGPTRAVRPASASSGLTYTAEQQQRQQEADILMGLAHRQRPHFGVQFHPESIATAFGAALLSNFRDLTAAHQALSVPRPEAAPESNGKLSLIALPPCAMRR